MLSHRRRRRGRTNKFITACIRETFDVCPLPESTPVLSPTIMCSIGDMKDYRKRCELWTERRLLARAPETMRKAPSLRLFWMCPAKAGYCSSRLDRSRVEFLVIGARPILLPE